MLPHVVIKQTMFEIIDGFAMWYMRSFSNNSTTTMRIQYDCVGCGQAALLQQAADALTKAREAALAGESNEFTALDLRAALKHIGEITGAVWNDDILNAVFGKFCIGK